MKRIGILTSGGDAPGMNAAIRSVVRTALFQNVEVMGIYRGFEGLIDGEVKLLNRRSVSNIIGRGGTVLKTSRSKEFMTEEGQLKGIETLNKNKIEGLVINGGNGSYRGALELIQKWKKPCICIPGTIDNDINGTDYTIGSDTALNTALDAIDKIRDTVSAMERIFVVEVMGRHCGYIALNVGLAGGAEQVVIPEREFNPEIMCKEIIKGNKQGKISWIVIVAEGIIRAHEMAEKIRAGTKLQTREVVLGHIQRGGVPTAKDRILATRLGAAAAELLLKGETSKAVGIISDEIKAVSL